MTTQTTTEIYIVNGARAAMGGHVGALKDFTAIELGAFAARAALDRSEVSPEDVGHVVMGNALQTSGDAIYGARHVGLKAGIPRHRDDRRGSVGPPRGE